MLHVEKKLHQLEKEESGLSTSGPKFNAKPTYNIFLLKKKTTTLYH